MQDHAVDQAAIAAPIACRLVLPRTNLLATKSLPLRPLLRATTVRSMAFANSQDWWLGAGVAPVGAAAHRPVAAAAARCRPVAAGIR